MLTFKHKPWTLTLLVSLILALSLASVVNAKDFERRDHSALKRIVQKRSPQEVNQGSAGAVDPAVAPSAEPSESASPSLPPPPSVVPSASASDSVAPASQSSAPVSDSPSQSASQPPPSQSNPPPSSPPPPSDPKTTPPPSNPTPENQPQPPPAAANEPGKKGASTVLHYETVAASQESQPPKQSGNASAARISVTVIAVIASVVGAIAIAWTVFRKWKLKRSKKFDERLNPIDWQPPSADDGGIPGARRHSTASSFQSGSGHSMNRGYGSTHNASIPDHDFTAGSSLAPGGGYSDMSRGPSPQPHMTEANMYGASMYNHQDPYGVPPHQAYGGQNYYNGNRQY